MIDAERSPNHCSSSGESLGLPKGHAIPQAFSEKKKPQARQVLISIDQVEGSQR